MSSYALCRTCREYHFLERHTCAPEWVCRFAKGGPIYADDEWEPVHAFDAETAAEKYCERYDVDGGEYTILKLGERNPPIVEVRAPLTTEVMKFRVVGESEPVYRGEKLE